MYKLAIY